MVCEAVGLNSGQVTVTDKDALPYHTLPSVREWDKTDRSGVSILWLGDVASLYCLSVTAR